jgi:hypothetical protein
MERRNFLTTVISGTTACALAPALAFGNPPPNANKKPTDKQSVPLKDTSFFWVRGFNYQPGYGDETGGYEDGTGWSIWRDLKIDTIKRELTRGVELFPEMTAVRIWLPYNVYLAQPEKFLKDFARFIDVIGELKLRAMVVIFNAWHGSPDFGGFRHESFPKMTPEALNNTFRFTDALLDRYAEDKRIFAWDLCNEPDVHLAVYHPWLKRLAQHIKSRKEKTCLTVGTYTIGALKALAPISDLISIHPYCNPNKSKPNANAHNAWVGQLIQIANNAGKPAIASEIGWGVGADDAARAARLHIELGACINHKTGFLVHALWHSPVADLHRPEYGPITGPGYMGCIEKDGSLRRGHEMIRDYLRAK